MYKMQKFLSLMKNKDINMVYKIKGPIQGLLTSAKGQCDKMTLIVTNKNNLDLMCMTTYQIYQLMTAYLLSLSIQEKNQLKYTKYRAMSDMNKTIKMNKIM